MTKRRRIVFVVVTSCLAAAAVVIGLSNPPWCSPLGASQLGRPLQSDNAVAGVVKDAETGRGIPNATARIGMPVVATAAPPTMAAVTHEQGRFAFPPFQEGQYRGIAVDAAGYALLSSAGSRVPGWAAT